MATIHFIAEDMEEASATLNDWQAGTTSYSNYRARVEHTGASSRPGGAGVPLGTYSMKNPWRPGSRCYREQTYEYAGDSRGLNPHYYIKSSATQRDMRHAGVHPLWGEANIDKINRHRLMMWIPEHASGVETDGRTTTVHWATHCRYHDAADNVSESDNGHWYHYYSPRNYQGWNMLLVDAVPHHRRNGSSSSENHDVYYPWPEHSPGYNYFDLMCRYYVRHWHRNDINPEEIDWFQQNYYLDMFEWWDDENDEDIKLTYAISGSYDEAGDFFKIQWSGVKPYSTPQEWELRYAFSDVHQLGWDNLNTLSNGVISRDTTGNGVFHAGAFTYFDSVSGEINVAGQPHVHFALRATNPEPDSGTFRQFHIPVQRGVILPV